MTDRWTSLKLFAIFLGRSDAPTLSQSHVPEHIDEWPDIDVVFQDKIRRRVDNSVHDGQLADMLKP